MSYQSVCFAAVRPVMKVFLVCFCGYMLKRTGKMNAAMRKTLSAVIVALLVPSFLFIKLMKGLTQHSLSDWWPLPAFVFLNLVLGLGFGFALVWIAGRKRCGGVVMEGVVKASCCIGNMGMLPLAMCWAACDDNLPRFTSRQGGVGMDCINDAMAMTATGLWVAGVAAFTLGDWLIKPRDEHGRPTRSMNATPEPQHPDGGSSETTLPSATSGQRAGGVSLGAVFKYLMSNPPLFSSLAALLCAFTSLSSLFLGKGAFLLPLTDALTVMADALVPIQLLTLGASFELPNWSLRQRCRDDVALTGETRQEGRGAEEGGVEKAVEGMEGSECVFLLDRLVVFGIAAVRLIILPFIGYHLSEYVVLQSSDPLIKFVVRVQFTVPTGMTLGTLCLLYDKPVADMTNIYTFQYLMAVPVVSAWLMLYML